MSEKILITGAASGLGKYCHLNIKNSIALTRENFKDSNKSFYSDTYDCIIHCAFGAQGKYDQNDLTDFYKYINDNILFLKKVIDIPHKKFVYISSLAVYEEGYTNYKYTKLYAESMIENLANNPLILRCSSLLGVNMKENNLLRLIKNPNCKITLDEKSEYNFVLYEDILTFIKYCLENNISKKLDFVALENILLQDIVAKFNLNPIYGSYNFKCQKGSINILKKIMPSILKTSSEAFDIFYEQIVKEDTNVSSK